MISILHSANNAGQGVVHKAGEDLAEPDGAEKVLNMRCLSIVILLSLAVEWTRPWLCALVGYPHPYPSSDWSSNEWG